MYMRALLATMLPEVEQRTAALRSEIERGKALEQRARTAAGQLRQSETALNARRQSLLALETRQRLESRQATGVADREAERALALAEQARDLGTLVDDLGRAGALRAELARLPGAILRPVRPEAAQVLATEAAPVSRANTRLAAMPMPSMLCSRSSIWAGAITVAELKLNCRPMARCMWSMSGGMNSSRPTAPAPRMARCDRSRERALWPSSRAFCSLRSDAGRLFSWLDSMVA